MSTFDVRKEESEITKIVFSESTNGRHHVAHRVSKMNGPGIATSDEACYVTVADKEHALNLKKALDKAIELGWLQ